MKKLRILSLLCCIVLLIATLSVTVWAADNVPYLDENGTSQTCATATEVTDSDSEVTWNAGWYVVQGNVTINSNVTVKGDVHLILADNCSLTSETIKVRASDNASLTIYAQSVPAVDENGNVTGNTGRLTADGTGKNNAAGIGGWGYNASMSTAGPITINGGVIRATSGTGGAGIGGGNSGAGGTITINGGAVTATGDDAGIGGGDGGSGGIITINGGTVTASGDYGAGIGGGNSGAGGTITINGGTVTATGGGHRGAGIGGGGCRWDKGGDGGTITINGGTVKATGGEEGAGIGGGGSEGANGGSGGTININGGTVTATGGGNRGAGIGGGGSINRFGGDGGNITISGGTVTANGTNDGAGIGGGIHNLGGGSFSTGTGGSALILASSISDQSGKAGSTWSGIIFEGDNGTVYGNQTLNTDLTIAEGQTLTIPADATLTNNGTIVNLGTINGTVTGNQPKIGVKYLDENGEEQTAVCEGITADFLAGKSYTLSAGWYVVTGAVTIGTAETPQRITVSGDVHLILADGCDFTVNGGIGVKAGNSLTIYGQSAGTGTLTATGTTDTDFGSAGIGGTGSNTGGTITINGGTINATGGGGTYGGAGIGGGGGWRGGNITINGGNVTANGGSKAAGIGGGGMGSADKIIINGGTVTATSTGGAGIGGGKSGDGGIITITGGNITATGGDWSAGIGGGDGGSGGTITIKGGTINATGGYKGAGMGSGYNSSGGTVTLKGGTVLSVGGTNGKAYSSVPTLEKGLRVSVGGSASNLTDVERTSLAETTYTGNLAVKTEICSTHENTAVYKDADNHTLTCKWCGTESEETHSFVGNGDCVCGAAKVNYLDEHGTEQTAVCQGVKADNIGSYGTLTTGWYVVRGEVTASSRINVSGTVHLILADGCNFTVSGGISVNKANSLTIYGQSISASTMGKLTATGGDYQAGIGGDDTKNCGTVTINGGTIKATGGNYGAGIGGGRIGNSGTITINGGIVNATGGNNGAGIGSGGSCSGGGGTITINGGYVEATGGTSGAGIGTGFKSSGGTITITGGTIKATGSSSSAGIGGGSNYDGTNPALGSGGTITITGGNVTSNGGYRGAGIGGGYNGDCGNITINGGTISATGGKRGAGIGGGDNKAGGTITINGGEIEATGGYDAAGIGGGRTGNGGTITINGGSVTAKSGGWGAGIGGGYGGSAGYIVIDDGTVNASCTGTYGYGAGIGSGGYNEGSKTNDGTIIINGGSITATNQVWGAGIGGGCNYTSGTVIITGGIVTAVGNRAGIGGGQDGPDDSFTTNITNEGGTTTDGNAIIFASSISDQSGKADGTWSGVIFEGDAGQVYGTTITPIENFTIESGKSLLIPTGSTLNISGINAVNNGSVYVDGTLSGALSGSGSYYYPLTVTGGTADNTYDYNTSTYGKAGETITLTGTAVPVGQAVSGWTVSDSGVTVENNAFTMPAKALTISVSGYVNAPTYTVTIPATVELGGTATVSASGVNVVSGSSLVVTLTDAQSFKLTTDEGAELSYGITKDSTALSVGSTVLTVAGGIADNTGSAVLTFSAPTTALRYSGVYKGTVTFTVAVQAGS